MRPQKLCAIWIISGNGRLHARQPRPHLLGTTVLCREHVEGLGREARKYTKILDCSQLENITDQLNTQIGYRIFVYFRASNTMSK